ncbi:HAMP domain-containing protein [Stappia indica]|uniref:histidine kinase n=2 Tax=Stappia indica TaxID=538381 RepID=A0A857CFE3_9HYPH|nr:HAMP domain-containing sensor histidine kinase [Stappia indica]QGZ37561.1 HAMP domain-containing protein [Stappia indica]
MTATGRLFRTTAIKLALIYLAALTLASGAVLVYLSQNTASVLREQVVDTVDAEISGLADQYRIGGIRALVATVDARSRRPGASLYLVTDFAANQLVGNIEQLDDRVLAGESGELQRVIYTPIGGGPRREALARVFQLSGGFRLLVGRDLQEQQYFRSLLAEAMRFWLFVLAALGLVTWVFVSRRVLKRIDAMTATSRRIMSGDLSERLPVEGSGDEFDRLAIGLNAMLNRIEALMQGLKDVSDNIAHDLKTPLTRMRNRLEEALRSDLSGDSKAREVLETTIDDCDALIRTFNALLRIARVEAGSSDASFDEIDVSELVREVAELYAPVAEDEGGGMELRVTDGLRVSGNRELLVQALINLVENALKYARQDKGEGARVELEARAEGGEVLLGVRDHGPGIPDADKERVLHRFVRLEASRSAPGSGLGLSLVAAVARLHRGRLELDDAQPGLMARLRLPAAGGADGAVPAGGD